MIYILDTTLGQTGYRRTAHMIPIRDAQKCTATKQEKEQAHSCEGQIWCLFALLYVIMFSTVPTSGSVWKLQHF